MKKLFLKKTLDQKYYDLIPKWAEFFIHTGEKVAAMIDDGYSDIVVGFSLPSRAYAVLFFLLGYESWNAKKGFKKQQNNHSYFQYLSECEQNEALLLLDKERWKRCWFKGIEMIGGSKFVKVDVPGSEKTRYTSYISMAKIVTLRKAVDPDRKVADNQMGFSMTGFDTLVKYYNKKNHEIIQFLIGAKQSYVVFGNKATIEKEITAVDLFYKPYNEYREIPIQHVLRFKNFMTDYDFSRGNIFSSRERCELPADDSTFPIIIYDSSLAYLNQQGSLQGKIEIIFLDRTEPQFSNACGELMARYYNRGDDLQLLDKKHSAFEVIAFKE